MEASRRGAGKKREICSQYRIQISPGQVPNRVTGLGIPGFIRRISQWIICTIMNRRPSVLARGKARLLALKQIYKL